MNQKKNDSKSPITRICRLILISSLLVSLAQGQSDFRFNGYFVNFPVYQRLNPTIGNLFGIEKNQFVDVSRFRLRPSVSLWKNSFLMLEYEVNATYTAGRLLPLATTSGNPRQVADLTWNPVKGARWQVVHYVDRLYVRQTTSVADVTIGRQRISWGTGRIWNPTDLFNPLNPTSYSKFEKDGVDAILAKIVLGNFSDLSIVYNAKAEFRDNNAGLRLRSNVEGFDLSVMAGVFDKRRVIGGDFAGSLLDAGVRGEILYSTLAPTPQTNFVSLVLGIDNQFSEKFYALAEYHFNGRGKTESVFYDLAALLRGEILNLGRQFLALQASYLLHPLVTTSLSAARSFTDQSGFFGGTVVYSTSEETSLSLGGQYFYGRESTEYWFYPSSIYFKFDFFF